MKTPNRTGKVKGKAIIALALLFMAGVVQAAVIPGIVEIGNAVPYVQSIDTFCYYINDTDNDPCTHFSAPYNMTVYALIVVGDDNGASEINLTGRVRGQIALWNGAEESVFPRFGTGWVEGTFIDSGSLTARHLFVFNMSSFDESRMGTEAPPLHYRVKARIFDGSQTYESSTDPSENADYTFAGIPPVLLNEIKPVRGPTAGFVEIVNTADYAVDLLDWAIETNGARLNLTGTIGPGEILVFFSNSSLLWANASADNVSLIHDSGYAIDIRDYVDGQSFNGIVYNQSQDSSLGRITDGDVPWAIFFDPTPGSTNDPPGPPDRPQKDDDDERMFMDLNYSCAGKPVEVRAYDEAEEGINRARIQAYISGRSPLNTRTDGDGMASFSVMGPGRYRITASKSGYDSVTDVISLWECPEPIAETTTTTTTTTLPPEPVDMTGNYTKDNGQRKPMNTTEDTLPHPGYDIKKYMQKVTTPPVIAWALILFIILAAVMFALILAGRKGGKKRRYPIKFTKLGR